MTVDLSIVIVNWNTRELLAGCLESVIRSQHSEHLISDLQPLSPETFVVDNASTNGSAAMVQERFPWVRLIENRENVGFARANNQGIGRATGRYVLLLNSDTVVHPGALATLVQFMDAHPRAGACGARLFNPDGSLQPACHPMLTPGRELWRLLFLDHVWPRATYPMGKWDATASRRVEVIKGACLLLRRAALDQIGLLDDRYFMYTEEVDLCFRLAQAGWELWYVPAAVVTHFGGASSRQVAEQMFVQLYRSKTQFFRKFGGESRAVQFKRFLAIAYWPRLVVASLISLVSGFLGRAKAGVSSPAGRVASDVNRCGFATCCFLPPGGCTSTRRLPVGTADLANRMASAGHEVHLVTTSHFPRDRYGADLAIHTPVATIDRGFSLHGLRLWELSDCHSNHPWACSPTWFTSPGPTCGTPCS